MTARLSSRHHRRKLKEAVSCEKLMAKRKPVILSEEVSLIVVEVCHAMVDAVVTFLLPISRVRTLWFAEK